MSVGRDELDAMAPECCSPDDDVVWLHSRCHVDVPAWARYTKGTGLVDLVCASCGKILFTLRLAEKGAPDG